MKVVHWRLIHLRYKEDEHCANWMDFLWFPDSLPCRCGAPPHKLPLIAVIAPKPILTIDSPKISSPSLVADFQKCKQRRLKESSCKSQFATCWYFFSGCFGGGHNLDWARFQNKQRILHLSLFKVFIFNTIKHTYFPKSIELRLAVV